METGREPVGCFALQGLAARPTLRWGARGETRGLALAGAGHLAFGWVLLAAIQTVCWAQRPGVPLDASDLRWEEAAEADEEELPEDRSHLIFWPPRPGEPGYVPPPPALPPAFTQALGSVDDQASIEHARDALGQGWGSRFPWYDEKNDDVRPLKIQLPAKPPRWKAPQVSFPSMSLSWVSWLVLLVFSLGLAWLLWRAYLAREKRQAAELPQVQRRLVSDASRIEALPFVMRRTDADLLGEAERYYRQENYSEAIIYLYSYLLVALDRAQIIRLAKGKTNRQYLRELGRRQRLREMLELVMVAFEDVFFGNHPLSRQRFEWCWSLLDEFHSLVQTAAA